MFSCEFYEISKNTFFTEHLWLTASKLGSDLLLLIEICTLKIFFCLVYHVLVNIIHKVFGITNVEQQEF